MAAKSSDITAWQLFYPFFARPGFGRAAPYLTAA
jgi:hypothetical protein